MRGTRGLVTGLCAVLVLLAACGDDDDGGGDTKKDSGPGAGRGGSSAGSSGSSSGSGGSGGMMITPLGNDVAGKECTSNTDCGGATCATQVPGAAILPATAPGGYCTGQCATNADCGNGGACVGALAGVINGQCFASCASESDCRDGYICAGGLMVAGITIPDTCRPKPATDQLGNGVAGKPCMAAADCSGGTCLSMRGGFMGMGGMTLPGGYCTGNCTEDSHCGSGGVCSPPVIEGLTGNCFEKCTDDSGCNREGYRCRDVGQGVLGCDVFPDPLPDNQAGKACTTDADCGGVMGTCESSLPGANFFANDVPAPGGYCSQLCDTDADCGAGGACIGAGIVSGACFKPCTAPADCRAGYTCATRGGMGMGMQAGDGGMSTGRLVCAPAATMNPDADAGAE